MTYLQNRNRLRDRKQMATKGKVGEKDKLGVLD